MTKVLAEHFSCINLSEVVLKALSQSLDSFTGVQGASVCCDRDNCIVSPVSQQLCGLDCGNDIANSRETEVCERIEQLCTDAMTL